MHERSTPVGTQRAPARLLMLLKTTGLQYDDRVRKEAASLVRQGARVHIAALETANRVASGSADGVTWNTVSLALRRWIPQARGVALKTIELYARMLAVVLRQRPDVLWLHNFEFTGFAFIARFLRALGVVGAVVWDQHELPPAGWRAAGLRRRFLTSVMRHCDAVVVASAERRGLLLEELGAERMALHVLENFPDRVFAREPARRLPAELLAWLGDDRLVLGQGAAAPHRNFDALVEAVMAIPGARLAVVGGAAETVRRRMRERWGEALDQKVCFVGMVPQLRMVDYIDAARVSVVFYADVSANSWYCAPNRLYQALVRGTRVLTGENPPLRQAVEATGMGQWIQGDGRDSALVRGALERELAGDAAPAQPQDRFTWEAQDSVIAEILAVARRGRRNGRPERNQTREQ